MKTRFLFLVALAVGLAPLAASVRAGDLHATYVHADDVSLQRVLPPPPAPGSPEAQADVDAVHAAVAHRTSADERLIEADLPTTALRFADVLGPGFTKGAVPLTVALVERAFEDAELVVIAAKEAIVRPRPYTLDPGLETLGRRSPSFSYPSGHTTFGRVAAVILSAMVPERKSALFARGDAYGRRRLTAGTHFPSDIAAGELAGSVIADALFRDERFRSDFAAARLETRKALGLGPIATKP